MKAIGQHLDAGYCSFTVWAPFCEKVQLHILEPVDRLVPMSRDDEGYWVARVEGVSHGDLYRYRLDDSIERADPASPSQPLGVHGPSMVVDQSRFRWDDVSPGWKLEEYIIYEMHVGTFTREGTFASASARLHELSELGVNAVEIMPVAQFPGKRNWGYDGVYPFAVQNSYGGFDGLKAFVNATHRENIAVVLDVVYNHLGPEGNYLPDFGPYFTDRYRTPWGESINFDGPYSDAVCDYFIQNAIYWLREFHVDALRIDAVHAITDTGARPFLLRLAEAVEAESRRSGLQKYLIAESDLNDSRIIRGRDQGGFGIHAQWSDDFHHSVHTLLTGESRGYYSDFGGIEDMIRTLKRGFCYSGDYSKARKRSHGNDVSQMHTGRFVVCSQNHDQVGNRMLGERLVTLTDTRRTWLAAAAVILSPYIPLLFMGEEHGEDNPFIYFADHTDESLKKAVREGRRREFAEFHESGEPPDPFALLTFEKSQIDRDKRTKEPYSYTFAFYKELIRVRRSCPAIAPCGREKLEVDRCGGTSVISIHYLDDVEPAVCLLNFGKEPASIPWNFAGRWNKRFDSISFGRTPESSSLPDVLGDGDGLRLEPYQSAVYISKSTEK